MSRYGYWRDPLFVLASAGYALNRWELKPRLAWPFLHAHFNDLLLIPAALPVVLWLQRRLQLRPHDQPPSGAEILLHLSVWSLICEFIGPYYLHFGTADVWDLAAYAVGGLAAFLWWNRPQVKQPARPT
jgi:hypothetical protein